jgi:hypothetical protein
VKKDGAGKDGGTYAAGRVFGPGQEAYRTARSFHIVTFGCKDEVHDSESGGSLNAMGIPEAPPRKKRGL